MTSFKRALIGTTALAGIISLACTVAGAATITVNTATTTTQNLAAGDNLDVTNTGSINVAGVATAVNIHGLSAGTITNDGTINTTVLDSIDIKSGANLTGGIQNNGIIGRGIGVTSSAISGSFDNNATGTITGRIFINGSSDIAGGIHNAGNIDSIVIGGHSNVSGGIFNTGLLKGKIALAGDSANLTGAIQNSGTISGTATGAIIFKQTSCISGTMTNNGVIKGREGIYLLHNTDISGGVINNGSITGSGSAGILVNGSDISGGIVNNGLISGFHGIVVETGKISGGIVNNPTGTIESTGGQPAILFESLSSQFSPLTGTTPIIIDGGRIVGDVVDDDPSLGFSKVAIGADFSTEGNFDVSSIEIGSGHTLTVSSGNTITEKTLTVDVASTSSFGKLVIANGGINLAGVTVNIHADPGVTLAVGDEIKIGDGSSNIVGGPGGTKTAVVDNTSLFDFQIADGTAASAPTDATDLFLFVVADGTNPAPTPTPTPPPGDPFGHAYDVLIGLDGAGISVLQTAIDAIKSSGTVKQLDDALSSVTPTVDGAGWQAARDTSDIVFDLTNRHLDNPGDDGLAETQETGVAAGNGGSGLAEWGAFFGQASDAGARGGIAGYSSNTYGFALGMEANNIARSAIIGAALSYGRTNADSRNTNTTSLGLDSYQLTLYGNRSLDHDAYLRGMAAYAYDHNDTDRHNVGGPGGPTASGSFGASQYAARAEIGRHFSYNYTTLTPSLLANWLHYDAGSYTETGAGGGNLKVHSTSMNLLELGGGIKAGRGWKNEAGDVFLPEVRAGYRYDLIGDRIQDTSSFTGGGGSFSLQGPKPARSRFNIGTGFTYRTTANWDFRANYDYDFRQDYHAHSGTLRATYKF